MIPARRFRHWSLIIVEVALRQNPVPILNKPVIGRLDCGVCGGNGTNCCALVPCCVPKNRSALAKTHLQRWHPRLSWNDGVRVLDTVPSSSSDFLRTWNDIRFLSNHDVLDPDTVHVKLVQGDVRVTWIIYEQPLQRLSQFWNGFVIKIRNRIKFVCSNCVRNIYIVDSPCGRNW